MIKLGTKVRDLASGLTGYAICFTETLSGMRQYGVQPYKEDGAEIASAYTVDLELIEIIDEGISARATEPDTTKVQLGHKVEDEITGVKGHVTQISTWLNGCVHVAIQPKGDGKKLVECVWVDHKRVIIKDAGVSEESKKPAPRALTGGPSMPLAGRRLA